MGEFSFLFFLLFSFLFLFFFLLFNPMVNPILMRIIMAAVNSLTRVGFAAFSEALQRQGLAGMQQQLRNTVKLKKQMDVVEARKILQVKDPITHESIMERYNHLLKINDPAKGGSKYLAAKITNARIALENELDVENEEGGDGKTEEEQSEKFLKEEERGK